MVGGRGCVMFAESDPPPSKNAASGHKQTIFVQGAPDADNCTMNFSDVGTAHHSRTVISAIAKMLVHLHYVVKESDDGSLLCRLAE